MASMLSNYTAVLILISSAIVFALISLLVNWTNGSRNDAWLPHLLLATGFSLTLLQSRLAPFLGIIIANMLIASAMPLLYSQIRQFCTVPALKRFNSGALILLLASFLYYTYFDFSTPARIILISLFYIIICAAYTAVLLRKPGEKAINRRAFAGLFAFYTLSSLLRLLQTAAADGPLESYLAPNTASFIAIYCTLLFILVWNLLYYTSQLLLTQRELASSVKKLNGLYAGIESLHRFMQKKESLDSMEDFFPMIFETLARMLQIESAAIYVLNSVTEQLELKGSKNLPEGLIESVRIIPMTSNFAASTAIKERCIVSKSISSYDEGPFRRQLELLNTGSTVSVPIFSGVVPMGAISFGVQSPEGIGDRDREILWVLSKQIGTALQNITLFRELNDSEKKYRDIFETADEAIIIQDPQGLLLDANRGASELLGYSLPELKCFNADKIEHSEYRPIRRRMVKKLDRRRHIRYESLFLDREGKELSVAVNLSKIHFRRQPALLVVARDISAQKAHEAQLITEARTDSLTGAFNRRAFDERISAEHSRIKRFGGSLSLLMLDIDDFKEINDTHGHDFGDRVLCRLTEIVKKSIRDADFFARYGGEEFIVAVLESEAETTCIAAERIREAVEEHEIRTSAGEPVRFSISIGIARLQNGDDSPEEVIKKADEALYQAKREGKNRVVYRE